MKFLRAMLKDSEEETNGTIDSFCSATSLMALTTGKYVAAPSNLQSKKSRSLDSSRNYFFKNF